MYARSQELSGHIPDIKLPEKNPVFIIYLKRRFSLEEKLKLMRIFMRKISPEFNGLCIHLIYSSYFFYMRIFLDTRSSSKGIKPPSNSEDHPLLIRENFHRFFRILCR
jgi:hypothetical protein